MKILAFALLLPGCSPALIRIDAPPVFPDAKNPAAVRHLLTSPPDPISDAQLSQWFDRMIGRNPSTYANEINPAK